MSETCVIRLPEGHFYIGVFPGGPLLWVMYSDDCLLGSLGFWSPINKGTSSLLGFHLSVPWSESFFAHHYPPTLCNFQSPSSYRPLSPTSPAFFTVVTPVTVYFRDSPAFFTSFGP